MVSFYSGIFVADEGRGFKDTVGTVVSLFRSPVVKDLLYNRMGDRDMVDGEGSHLPKEQESKSYLTWHPPFPGNRDLNRLS